MVAALRAAVFDGGRLAGALRGGGGGGGLLGAVARRVLVEGPVAGAADEAAAATVAQLTHSAPQVLHFSGHENNRGRTSLAEKEKNKIHHGLRSLERASQN